MGLNATPVADGHDTGKDNLDTTLTTAGGGGAGGGGTGALFVLHSTPEINNLLLYPAVAHKDVPVRCRGGWRSVKGDRFILGQRPDCRANLNASMIINKSVPFLCESSKRNSFPFSNARKYRKAGNSGIKLLTVIITNALSRTWHGWLLWQHSAAAAEI